MTGKLSVADRKELDKYIKNMIMKLTQVIVQSRLGEKLATKSRPFQTTGADWFNLDIPEVPDVIVETKRSLTFPFPVGRAVCVEISLTTTDGDTLTLERWKLSKCGEVKSDSMSGERALHNIYNHMTTLLKSTFSVSRATPTYLLSRKQGADSYVICYQIYDEPVIACTDAKSLGEDHRCVHIGSIEIPGGRLSLDLSYRTQLMMQPDSANIEMFDDASYRNDHFKTGGLSGSQYLASSPVATTANNRRVCHCQQDRRYSTASEIDLAPDHFNASPVFSTPPSLRETPPLFRGTTPPPHRGATPPFYHTPPPAGHPSSSPLTRVSPAVSPRSEPKNRNNSTASSDDESEDLADMTRAAFAAATPPDIGDQADGFLEKFSHLLKHIDTNTKSTTSVTNTAVAVEEEADGSVKPSGQQHHPTIEMQHTHKQVITEEDQEQQQINDEGADTFDLAFKELTSPFIAKSGISTKQHPSPTAASAFYKQSLTSGNPSSEVDLNTFYEIFNNDVPDLFAESDRSRRGSDEINATQDSVSALLTAFYADAPIFDDFTISLNKEQEEEDEDR